MSGVRGLAVAERYISGGQRAGSSREVYIWGSEGWQ